MVLDFFFTLSQLVTQLWIDGRNAFFVACISGVVLGTLTWLLAHLMTTNINRQFSFRLQHHFFCVAAALATILFTVLFVALRYTEHVAESLVTVWEASIRTDEQWSRNTYKKAYDAVYDLRDAAGNQLEDFSGRPHPNSGNNTTIPTSYDASKLAVANTYAREAVDHFRDRYPFLSKILWAHSEKAMEGIVRDMKRVFEEKPGGTYQASDAVQIAGDKIIRNLKDQVDRVVIISRIILVAAFIFIQAIVFGFLARSALADIRENFSTQRVMGQ